MRVNNLIINDPSLYEEEWLGEDKLKLIARDGLAIVIVDKDLIEQWNVKKNNTSIGN